MTAYFKIMDNLLFEKLNAQYTKDVADAIVSGLKKKKYATFRLNRLKSTKKEIEDALFNNNIKYECINGYDDAFVIKNVKEPYIEKLDIYVDGKIYMQNLSSMAPIYVLDPKQNENILDMCAAPGSKTTFIQSLCNNKVNLTAVELHKDRYERLKYNCERQNANVYLINKNAIDLDDFLKFDKILLDAPCSGSGTISLKDNSYEKIFTDSLISKCVKTQRKLIEKASKLLKKGGNLIYSTCSLLQEENEEMVDFALKYGFSIDKTTSGDYKKIFPNEYFEGFFIAKLRKN